ncbi:hypothetical protein B4135_1004 [Caldibacillus debilis]|uniref:Uncharacterized protein n=1 Tax=Caldibacillus debilis TaxID=301148 RepID=A0A150MF79_9BACI|nr:hypothetical protein B4135_1004 [Caldibacillus debilis]
MPINILLIPESGPPEGEDRPGIKGVALFIGNPHPVPGRAAQ